VLILLIIGNHAISISMQVQKLLKLLEQGGSFSAKERVALESLIKHYPYFSLGHALIAKIADNEAGDLSALVEKAAVYATDPSHLQKWLQNNLEQLKERPKDKLIQDGALSSNSYLESILSMDLQKSTNPKSIDQFMLIDKILEENLQFDSFVETIPLESESDIDLSVEWTTLDDRFITETLAKLMVQQKKYQTSIEIYERLILKYPEKTSYFADIIANLKNNL